MDCQQVLACCNISMACTKACRAQLDVDCLFHGLFFVYRVKFGLEIRI